MRLDGSRVVSPLLALAAASGGAATVAAALSCIPDLPADARPRAVCGDGYIDLAAGEQCDPGPVLVEGGVCSLDCKVVCPGLRWPSNDHCYTAQQASRALRTTAESTCNVAGGGHVATFASEDELSAAAAYAHDAGASDFWVGLVDDAFRYTATAPNEPGWSPQCAGCYAHTDDPSAALHLPRDVEAGAGCVISTYVAAGTPVIPPWDQHPCDSLLPIHVLCEREPVGSHARPCDGGVCMDLVYTAGKKRYVFVANPMGAHEADAFCAARGGTLVVLESRDEREQLWRELAQLGQVPVKVWIGLATDDAGTWTWDDGTKVDAAYPPPWGVRQPLAAGVQALMQNDPNGTVDDTLAMAATDPATTLPFVCEIRTSKARLDTGPEAGRDSP